MEHKDLEYIIEVAKCGSILKASENLYISPSALSQYVKNVENKIGVALFDRAGKQFRLSYAGKKYYDWATKIVDMENHMKNEIDEIVHLNNGRIRIGFPTARSKFIITNVIPEFKRKFPHMEIILEEDRSFILHEMIQKNEIDVILTNVDNLPPPACCKTIASEEIVLAVPIDHHLLSKAVKKSGFQYPWIDFNLCRDENFIMLNPNQYLRHISDNILSEYNIIKPVIIQLRNIKSALNCISSGLGITILFAEPMEALDFKDSIKYLSFGEEPKIENFVVAFNKEQEKKNMIEEFIKGLIEQYNIIKDICR